MSIPIVLPVGSILVYGWGQTQSPNGVIPVSTSCVFGIVEKVWAGGEVFVYNGDYVKWKDGTEVECKFAYLGNPYTQLKARLVTKLNDGV